jgi:hypothetical protein
VFKEDEHLSVSGSFETACSKIQDCYDLFPRQVEPFHDVLDAGSRFEIFEDRSNRHARATVAARRIRRVSSIEKGPQVVLR